ncbi:metallophosphoesterase family protein [[Eubacterium] cellulosolvens]
MRIVIISDIHSNLEALEAVISSLGSYDEIFCLGDLVGYGAQPNEVISRLRFLKPGLLIAGNHDFAVVTGDTSDFASHAALAVDWTRQEISSENLSYLREMQLFSSFTQHDICVKAYHGSPREPLNEYVFPGTADFVLKSMIETAQCDVLLLGHTHMPIKFRSNSLYLFNPGSVGQPRDRDPRASYGILEIEKENVNFEIKKVNYDIDSAAAKILEKPVPNFLADRLHLGY